MTYELHAALSKATIDDYNQLFRAAFGPIPKLSSDYLRWLYEANPNGKVVGFDAYKDGELAAHYATIPRVYNLGGLMLSGLLSVNTATHPSHQRRGLFAQLASATYERARHEGYHFVVGVANTNSIQGFLQKLEFRRLGQVSLSLRQPHPEISPNSAHLSIEKEWLDWRLANPSARYFITRNGKNESKVYSYRGLASFCLGQFKNELLPRLPVASFGKRCLNLVALTPAYPKPDNSLVVPERLKPSPWHVIVRNLASPASIDLDFHFDGLAMDSF